MESLAQRVQREAPFLQREMGFWEDCNRGNLPFRARLVDLQNDHLRLRFVHEISGTIGQVAPLFAPEDWWDLFPVIDLAYPGKGWGERSVVATIPETAVALRDHYPGIRKLYSRRWRYFFARSKLTEAGRRRADRHFDEVMGRLRDRRR